MENNASNFTWVAPNYSPTVAGIKFKRCPTDDSCVEFMELLMAYSERPDWNLQRLLIRKIIELCAVDYKVEQLTLLDIDEIGKALPRIIEVVYGKSPVEDNSATSPSTGS